MTLSSDSTVPAYRLLAKSTVLDRTVPVWRLRANRPRARQGKLAEAAEESLMLAEAHAAAGRFEEAAKAANRADDLAVASGRSDISKTAQKQHERYRSALGGGTQVP